MTVLKSELQGIKAEKKTPIPGSAEEDKQQIADIDGIRLNALDLVKSVLNIWSWDVNLAATWCVKTWCHCYTLVVIILRL